MKRFPHVIAIAAGLALALASAARSDDAAGPPPATDPVAAADPGAIGEPVCLTECCSQPCWTVYSGGIFLGRESSGSVSLFNYMADGETALNASELSFDHQLGPEIDIVRHGTRGRDLQIRYFGVYNWDSEVTVHGDENQFSFSQFGLFLPDIEDFTVRYSSRLDSLELNLAFPTERWITPLIGARWVQLHEGGLAIVDQFLPGLYDRYEVNANNALVGAQIGAAGRIWNGPRLRIDSVIKGGIYGNTASRSFDADVGLVGHGHLEATNGTTAFVGELGLTATYQLTDRLAVRAGYQWMWLDGIALAPDQIPGTTLTGFDPTSELDRSTLMLDGATVGAELRF